MTDLKPCPNPWCEALEREGDYSPQVRSYLLGTWHVACSSCGMEGPKRATESEAIAAWDDCAGPKSDAGDRHDPSPEGLERERNRPPTPASGDYDHYAEAVLTPQEALIGKLRSSCFSDGGDNGIVLKPRNPEGAKAAALIEAQARKIERLQRLINGYLSDCTNEECERCIIARRALEGSNHD